MAAALLRMGQLTQQQAATEGMQALLWLAMVVSWKTML
jgi:hypothetical protein